MPETVCVRLCLCLRDRTNNTDIGQQVRIGLNIAKLVLRSNDVNVDCGSVQIHLT